MRTRPGARPEPGRGQLTERDLEVLRFLVRHGAATADQVGRRLFGSRVRAYARLGLLVRQRLAVHVRLLYDAPGVYAVTAAGAQLADCGLPAARLQPGWLRHHLAVVDLAEELLAAHPGSTWTTERELRRDVLQQRRDPGSGRLGWSDMSRTPDGLLTLEDGTRVAIEIELSNKTSERYRAILMATATHRPADRVWWFIRSDAARARIAEAARPFGFGDFLELRPWPTRR